MNIVKKSKHEKVYKCDECGKAFTWNKDSWWYGSYGELDEAGRDGINVFCSDGCKNIFTNTRRLLNKMGFC